MTGFALFDTAIGCCGIAWGPRERMDPPALLRVVEPSGLSINPFRNKPAAAVRKPTATSVNIRATTFQRIEMSRN